MTEVKFAGQVALVTGASRGIGAAIAAELVRLHGGMIALEPSETGAVFKVTLPAPRSASA